MTTVLRSYAVLKLEAEVERLHRLEHRLRERIDVLNDRYDKREEIFIYRRNRDRALHKTHRLERARMKNTIKRLSADLQRTNTDLQKARADRGYWKTLALRVLQSRAVWRHRAQEKR